MGQVGFTDCHRPAHRVWNLCRHGESSVTLRLLPLSADWHIAHIGWSPSATVVVDLELLESVDNSGLSLLFVIMFATYNCIAKRSGYKASGYTLQLCL